MGYDLTGREDFFKAAKAQIDYILGCNPVNYCYVTGAGSKPVVNPHHRPSGASGRVYPGMLSGGPCAGLLDAYAKEHRLGFTMYLIGDSDNDGALSIKDATLVQKASLAIEKIVHTGNGSDTVFDYNGDGTVNITDATEIQKAIVS